MMKHNSEGYQAALVGFYGAGSTQEAALDDLLAQMRNYVMAANGALEDLRTSLSERLRQVKQIIDQIAQKQS